MSLLESHSTSPPNHELDRQTSKEVLLALDRLKKILRDNSAKLDSDSFLNIDKSQRKTENDTTSHNNTLNNDFTRTTNEGTLRTKRRNRSRNATSTNPLRTSQLDIKLHNTEQDNNESISNDIELPPPPEPNLELLQFQETLQALQDSQIMVPTPDLEQRKQLKRRNRRSHLWKELSEPIKSDDAELVTTFEMRESTYEYGSFSGTAAENYRPMSVTLETNTFGTSTTTASSTSDSSSTTTSSGSTNSSDSTTNGTSKQVTKTTSLPVAASTTTASSSSTPNGNSKAAPAKSASLPASFLPAKATTVKASRGAIVIGPKKKKKPEPVSMSLSMDSVPLPSSTSEPVASSNPTLSCSLDSAALHSSLDSQSTNANDSSTIPSNAPTSPMQARTRTSAFYDDATAERKPNKSNRPVSETYSSSPTEHHSQLSSSNGAKSARSTLDTTALFQLTTSSSEQPVESKTITKTSSSTSIIKMKIKASKNAQTETDGRGSRKSTTSRFSAMIGLQPPSVFKIVEGLQKYLEKLEMLVVESERTKSETQMRLHETKVDAAKQIRIFKKWHRKILVTSYRNLAQIEIQILDNVVAREHKKIEFMKEKIAAAEQLMEDVQGVKEVPAPISNKYKSITGENIQKAFHANAEIESHVKFIKKAQRAAKNHSTNFKRHFNTESKPMVPEQRKKILDDILDLADDIERDEHIMYDKVQRKFNEFILDQRYKEGQRLEQLLSRLRSVKHHVTTKIAAPEIAQYLEDFAEEVASDLGLDPSDEDLLAELTEAAVYPAVLTDLFENYFTQPRHFNEKLNKNRQYLSKLSFQKLPLELKVPETAEVLLQIRKGVERLNGMVYSMTPRYMTQAVEDTLQLIYELLKKNNHRDVGADDILPVFIYTLIHCNVQHLWKYVDFTSQFLSPREANGQLGYCAVTLQAAVMFLTQLDLTDAANKHN